MPKGVPAPEWLSANIQEFYPACEGNIRAIQRAIREKRGVEIPYMTVTDRMKRLELERPRDKSKRAPRETPMIVDQAPVEVLPGQLSIDDANTPPDQAVSLSPIGDMVPVNEAQARPLTRLPPEQQAEVWREAVKTAPAGKVTAKHVQETVKRAKATGPAPSKPTSTKPFDVHSIETKMKDLYMDWLKHCETDDALETAQFFLNTLSDLAQGRAMLLHRQ